MTDDERRLSKLERDIDLVASLEGQGLTKLVSMSLETACWLFSQLREAQSCAMRGDPTGTLAEVEYCHECSALLESWVDKNFNWANHYEGEERFTHDICGGPASAGHLDRANGVIRELLAMTQEAERSRSDGRSEQEEL